KAGTHWSAWELVEGWIPAFAGTTVLLPTLLSREGSGEIVEKGREAFIGVFGDLALGADCLEQLGVFRAQLSQHQLLEPRHVGDIDAIEIAAGAGEDHHHLLLDRHRREL